MSYPIRLTAIYPETSSRGLLLLRTFFGFFYVLIPHGFLLMFYGFWAAILMFISWWIVLFTGKYPREFFNTVVNYYRWSIRVNNYMEFLTDVYPPFNGRPDENYPIQYQVDYPEKLSRGLLLLRIFLGWLYIGVPHGIMVGLRYFLCFFIFIIVWFAILINGKYPKDMFDFVLGTERWSARMNGYYSFLTDEYPPLSGKE